MTTATPTPANANRQRILAMGNALVDILIPIPSQSLLSRYDLPKGTMTLVDKETANRILSELNAEARRQSTGGSAANTINGLARLGIQTGYIGKVGADGLGSFFTTELAHNHIESFIFKGSHETGRAITLISEDGERTFATYLGAAVELSAADLKPELFRGYGYFHIEGYLVQDHLLLQRALELAREAGLTISLDLASSNVVTANLEFLRSIIAEYVDIVFANEEEATAFTGKAHPHDCLADMSSTCRLAIVKQGKQGSLIHHENGRCQVQSIEVDTVDTTGAGDLYAAGFLFGLVNGYSPEICGRIGSILGGLVVEVLGAKLTSDQWRKARERINKEISASFLARG